MLKGSLKDHVCWDMYIYTCYRVSCEDVFVGSGTCTVPILFSIIHSVPKKERCSAAMTSLLPKVKLLHSTCCSWTGKDLWTGWGGKGSQKDCSLPTSPLAVHASSCVPWLCLKRMLDHIMVVSDTCVTNQYNPTYQSSYGSLCVTVFARTFFVFWRNSVS